MSRTNPITPLLVYEDIEAAHDFLVEAFGLEPGGVSRDGDGEVVHGEVRAGAAVILLHRVSAAHELASPSTQACSNGGLVVDVEDVDAHCAHARAAGARIDSEPTDQPYARREYGARDREGHRWWFGTPLE